MTFLVGLAASILEWLIAKLAHFGVVEVDRLIESLKVTSQAKKDAQALKDAKTDDQAKAALNNAIDDTFKS